MGRVEEADGLEERIGEGGGGFKGLGLVVEEEKKEEEGGGGGAGYTKK